MTIEEAIQGLIVADVTVQALVGTRVYPDQAPESSAYPRIVYQQAERQPVMTMQGPVASNKYTLDLEINARTKSSAKAVAKAVRDLLLGYRGSPSGVRVMGIFGETESDDHDIPQHGDERGIFSVSMTLSLWFRQPS